MNAAGEKQINVAGGDSAFHSLQDDIDRLLPKDEARARADVTAALATFQNESARAVFQEAAQ